MCTRQLRDAGTLEMLKLSLTGELLKTDSLNFGTGSAEELTRKPFDANLRKEGLDWPAQGLTMVGRMRLENIEKLLFNVIEAQVPGDFVECGVWRGGASLYAKGVLKALDVHDRKVHLVDSFEGLPKASQERDRDVWSEMNFLKVSLEQVQEPFKQLGLFDDGVAFHKGFFKHSLPLLRKQLLAEKKNIAVLRMDGDMFESTMDILYNLYDLVSVGGCVIIDDFEIREAKEAVATFLQHHKLTVQYIRIDNFAAYFCKERETKVDTAWYKDFNKKRAKTSSMISLP
jgi:O-methyltransferase